MLTVSTNVAEFNRTLAQYIAASGKTPAVAAVKQATKLGFELSRRLRLLTPGKGAITASVLAGLKSGIGIKLREGARTAAEKRLAGRKGAFSDLATRRLKLGRAWTGADRKGMNVQAYAVKRELALRERGRGYSAFAARVRSLASLGAAARRGGLQSLSEKHFGRYRQYLASAGLKMSEGDGTITMTWGGLDKTVPTQIGGALQTPQQEAALVASLREVRRDMIQYLRDEFRQNARMKLGTS